MDLPDGFTGRPATRADAEAATALANAAELVDLGEPLLELGDVEADWASPGIDLDLDTILVFDGDRLVASAEVSGERADVVVHPDVRGRGLGTALVGWTERRARARTPAGGTTRIGQTVPTGSGAAELLRSRGYEPRWESWVLGLPEGVDLVRPTPPGVEIRPYRPGEERDAYRITDTAFSEWESHESQTFAEWEADVVERPDFDPSLLLLAIRDDVPVGAAFGIAYPGEGWVDRIAVDADHRGRGIASALLATLFGEFRARGLSRRRLNTDSRTGALTLYLRLGMVVELSFTRWSTALG